MNKIKILLLADTHLGIDLPSFQRVRKRRLGNDFQKAYLEILHHAVSEKVDFIVHGGDMFYRALVKEWLIQQAYLPLAEIASKNDIPILLVPGNHERSRLPYNLFSEQNNINTFRIPSTLYFEKNGISISFTGFPCVRDGIRDRFKNVLKEAGYHKSEAHAKFICMHQSVEGATVGIQNFTFKPRGKGGEDVIQMKDIPIDCTAILSGHIHRQQILNFDLTDNKSPAPVIYPGSIQRTAFAERNEEKGFYIIDVEKKNENTIIAPTFIPLYTSSMHLIEIQSEGVSKESLHQKIMSRILKLPEDSIVKIKLIYEDASNVQFPSLKKIESLAPPTMKITMNLPSHYFKRRISRNDEPA